MLRIIHSLLQYSLEAFLKICFRIAKKAVKTAFLYSMKIKEQTRKLAAGCSKHSFEVAGEADVV